MRGIQTPKIERDDVEYICDDCKRGFYTERGLKRHRRRNHEE